MIAASTDGKIGVRGVPIPKTTPVRKRNHRYPGTIIVTRYGTMIREVADSLGEKRYGKYGTGPNYNLAAINFDEEILKPRTYDFFSTTLIWEGNSRAEMYIDTVPEVELGSHKDNRDTGTVVANLRQNHL